jgi:branched-chain amino acid transport system substrate-binding protein
VAVLYDETTSYSVGLADYFEKAFVKLGGKIELKQAFKGANLMVDTQVDSIHNAKVDAIYLPTYYSAVATIARKLRERGVTVPLLGADGWDSEELARNAGPAIEGAYYTNHFAPDDPRPIVKAFVTRYREKHRSEPDGLAALGYDSALLLFAAMGRARSLSGKDLAAAIASTKNFYGVTGSFTMRPSRDPKKSVAIVELKVGKPSLVEMILPP